MIESELETQNLYVKGPRVARACKPRAQEMEIGGSLVPFCSQPRQLSKLQACVRH